LVIQHIALLSVIALGLSDALGNEPAASIAAVMPKSADYTLMWW
jgi:hypothetical protein